MRYFQCKNIVAKAFVFFIGYATFSLFVSESKTEEVAAQQPNIILSQTISQNSSDNKKNTEGKKPTESNNTEGKKPTESNNTEGKKPTESNNTEGKKPTESNNTGGKKPTESNNTGGKKPTEPNNTEGKKPTESNNTGGKKPTESNNTGGKKPTESNEQLKGTWEGKLKSSEEGQSITYIFGEKDQLYMIYDSSIGKFAVERKYKVVTSKPPVMKTDSTSQERPKSTSMKIDINFGSRKVVKTIFKLDEEKGNLLIELAELNSDYPKEFSNYITFTRKSDKSQPEENIPISRYQP
jgi:hypothetical protein